MNVIVSNEGVWSWHWSLSVSHQWPGDGVMVPADLTPVIITLSHQLLSSHHDTLHHQHSLTQCDPPVNTSGPGDDHLSSNNVYIKTVHASSVRSFVQQLLNFQENIRTKNRQEYTHGDQLCWGWDSGHSGVVVWPGVVTVKTCFTLIYIFYLNTSSDPCFNVKDLTRSTKLKIESCVVLLTC